MTVKPPPSFVLLLLAMGAGLSAANLYYNQPMLGLLAQAFETTEGRVGLVPMATQAGYAIGILGFAPLGDRYERSRVIIVKAIILVAALAMVGLAPTFEVLVFGSFLVGLFATIAQDFVPAAAAIAPAESRGKVVGRVMTGLLTGILLSRVVSGAAGARFGWRAMFLSAAVVMALFTVVCARTLPRFPPTTREPYGRLLASTIGLVRANPELRRAALAQALISISFSGYWSTLALALRAPPFHLGSAVAGTFGLAGAAGAIGASVFGPLADRKGPESVIRIGAGLVALAFAFMAAWQGSLVALAVGAIVFDLGVSGTLIGHQTVVYGLDPAARSRLNAVLVTSMFLGMAAGSFVASQLLGRFGWVSVCLLGAGGALACLAVRLTRSERSQPSDQPAR
jgi:predicted MFS family arabinose efflux permease